MKDMKVVDSYEKNGVVVEVLEMPSDWSLEDEVEFQEMKAKAER